ncbi:MAG TPA: response regulator transcription factor [Candidatus Cryptobacteroides pullicola]|nr:response regulator transcription factor [Candidatus Cryptobacteroides pullicola]
MKEDILTSQDASVHILIADDSEIFRAGLKAILGAEKSIYVDSEASSCSQIREILEEGHVPDVILLDISMDMEDDGLEMLSWLNGNYPGIKVVILSHYKELRFIVEAVRKGARAYLAKDTAPSELIGALMAVRQGNGVYFGESIPSDLLARSFGGDDNMHKGRPYRLSDREMEILKMLSGGLSVKEISNVLAINVSTVESYKERIKNKLGADTTMEAVVFAVKQGLF